MASCKKTYHNNSNAAYYNNGQTDSLHINQIEVLASHNSYHKKTDSAVFAYISAADSLGFIPDAYNPAYIDYNNVSLTEQLNTYGVRGFELDVWNDPNGGHYYNRMGYYLMQRPAASNIPALLAPGFKVLHIPDFDFVSTNYTFVDAITEIKQWSDAHPNHIPIFINVETEVSAAGDEIPQLPDLTKAIPFDATAADELDREVKSVFGNDLQGVITPDQVRGRYQTLEQAVLANNWPTLGQARGKVIFIIDPDGNTGQVYKTGHPSLAGRAMFVYSDPGEPEAAFVKRNDPTGSYADIQHLVSKGYILRTMCDEATQQARTGDYSRMNTAFAGWAQILSTDYYHPDPRAGTPGWTNYQVQFPGGKLARIDSISAYTRLDWGAIKE